MPPIPRPRTGSTADETRSRILEKSEELFRRLGFAKTAVADIAGELGMSPANVYRFFASKNALVEAICQQHLARIHADLSQIARAPAPVADRLERFVIGILRYHKANFLHERRLHDIVLVAMEHSWGRSNSTSRRWPASSSPSCAPASRPGGRCDRPGRDGPGDPRLLHALLPPAGDRAACRRRSRGPGDGDGALPVPGPALRL